MSMVNKAVFIVYYLLSTDGVRIIILFFSPLLYVGMHARAD